MTNLLEKYNLHIQNGMFCVGKAKSVGRPKILTDDKLLEHLKLQGVSIKDISNIYSELIKILEQWVPEQKAEDDSSQMLIDKIKELDPFKKMFKYKNINNKNQQLVYYQKTDNEIIPVCALKDFTPKAILNFFLEHDENMCSKLYEELTILINPKKPDNVNSESVFEKLINVLRPEVNIPTYEVTQDPHPVVLSTHTHIPALKYIPFVEEEVAFQDLNDYVRDFLQRTTNHKHLCAILYTNLIGIKTPYVIYLHGEGRDGKSSFQGFLENLVKGSSATYTSNQQFGMSYVYGNSWIFHNEEDGSSYLMQQQNLKRITGSDLIQIEKKGESSFGARIRGMLIVTSNKPPKIIGTNDEVRRLRYFFIRTILKTDDEILGTDEAIKRYSKDSNVFINYCRQCYNELKTTSGELIKNYPEFERVMKSLRDDEIQADFEKIYGEIFNQKKLFEINPEGSCLMGDLKSAIRTVDKSKFAVENFEKILKVDYNIKIENGQYIGIQKRQRKE
jgi:hypothetical protein